MKNNLLLISLLILSSIATSPLLAQECNISSPYKKLEVATASASSWDNLRNNPGSLRFESDRLLKQGYQVISANSSATLALESLPRKYLSEYDDFDYCQTKLSETSKNPIKFGSLSFNSIDELTKWFSDFSQGSGVEGKQLYKICDKSCSPQYNLKIENKMGKLSVDASVICGHARDKDDNMYSLCTASAS